MREGAEDLRVAGAVDRTSGGLPSASVRRCIDVTSEKKKTCRFPRVGLWVRCCIAGGRGVKKQIATTRRKQQHVYVGMDALYRRNSKPLP